MAQAYNPFAFLGRLGKQNPKWAKDINNMSGFGSANTTMGYLNAGQKALKGDIKGGLEAGADTYLRTAVPVYGAIKTFNDLTGGININRMINPRKPVYDEADLARKAMMTGEIESQRNLASEQIRGATERRQAIRPMQDKVQSDILDMLTQGLSSRQLAPIYGAGEARNRQIGAASQAAMQQQLASRGVGGGVQAGVEQANLASQNERSAALNNAITQQQIQQRPEMLNMASNLLAQRDAQALSEMQYGQGLNLQASQMANQQALAERQLRMQEDAASRARRQQEMESVGQLMALLSPELQRMKNRGKKPTTPGVTPDVQPDMPLMVEEVPTESFQMPMPSDSAIPELETLRVQDVLRDVFRAGNPNLVIGESSRVTDIATIDKIEANPNKQIQEDLGNGVSLIAYKDPASGQYFKRYTKPRPDNAILTESEERRQRGTSPLGFAKSFYG
jgi:hypothetical protein